MTRISTGHVARLLAMLLALLVGLTGCGPFDSGKTTITVELANSAGLFVGNDVGVLGVSVGSVTEIEPRGDHVSLTLEVDPDVKIPADAGAVVVSRSMATDRYVELTPVYKGGATMKSGAVIEQRRTRTPVEWDEVLAAIDTLSEGLNGNGENSKPLRRLLDRTAASLDGNGKVVRRTLDNLVDGTGAFAEHSDDFAETLDSLDTLTAAIADNDKLARRFIRNVSATTNLVRDERINLQTAVDSLSETINLLAIFVKHHKGDMTSAVSNITDLSERILKHKGSLGEFLEVMPVAMENLGRAINDKKRLDVRLPVLDLLPGTELVHALCAPLGPLGDAVCRDLVGAQNLGEILDVLTSGGKKQ
ncbi:MCE family protein [Nocardioides sp. JQ2195]|uniref:MCE family protein n=1 Tax=Nocardioides sp. JQ2195 TaxID=2592334 RepID=UPI00143E44DF|nr:MCE family protein [Nocardioides sp. JQ2195]QIX26608.1 MCE family protein [Nocardioides sp. JQ2195]